MAIKGDAEYLPPIVTELKADLTGLRAGFAEAEKLQERYERSVGGLNDTLRETQGEFRDTGRSATSASSDVDGALSSMASSAETSGSKIHKTNERIRDGFRGIGDESERTSRKVVELERIIQERMRNGETYLSSLRREHDRLIAKRKELIKEFSRPFSSKRAGLFGDLDDVLGNINRIRKLGTDLGIELGEATGRGFGSVVAASGPYGLAAIIAAALTAAVLLAPAIGAAIAAALSLGLGAGVIGLGIMILKDEPALIKAAERMGKKTSETFTKAAQPLKKPLIEAMDTFGSKIKELQPELTKLFAAASPLIAPIAGGLMEALELSLPTITEAVKNSQPAFDALGKSLPVIVGAFADFMLRVTENGDDVSLFITDFASGVSVTLFLLSQLIAGLTTAYGWIRRFSMAVQTGLSDAFKKVIEWRDGMIEWAKTALKAVGDWLMQGLWGGISGGWGSIKSKIDGVFSGIIDAAKRIFDQNSPSKEFEAIGRNNVEGLRIGTVKAAPRAWAAWAGLLQPSAAARGSATTGGVSSAMTVRPAGGGGLDGVQMLQPIVLKIDGREVHAALVPISQRYKARTGETGLG